MGGGVCRCLSILRIFPVFMYRLKAGLLGCFVGIVLCCRSHADVPVAAPAPWSHPLANAAFAPALKEAAEREHISLFHTDGVGENAVRGDSEVFWIGATSGMATRQWLIQFSRGATTPEEQKAHRAKDVTKYLSWGPVVVFKSEVNALDVWIAGPVDTSAAESGKNPALVPARVHRIRMYVPRDFLQLGLDDAERASSLITRRTREILQEDPKFSLGHIYCLDKPIKPENVRYAKPGAARIGFTPEMERAWAGGSVALNAFYELADDVPEMKEIAEIVFKRPAVWKLGKLAFGAHFKTMFGGMDRGFVDSGKMGFLPVPMASIDMPFSYLFENELIVSGAMLVTRPAPPLDVGAGILAIIAYHPTDKTRAVELRVISSARGAVKTEGISEGR